MTSCSRPSLKKKKFMVYLVHAHSHALAGSFPLPFDGGVTTWQVVGFVGVRRPIQYMFLTKFANTTQVTLNGCSFHLGLDALWFSYIFGSCDAHLVLSFPPPFHFCAGGLVGTRCALTPHLPFRVHGVTCAIWRQRTIWPSAYYIRVTSLASSAERLLLLRR